MIPEIFIPEEEFVAYVKAKGDAASLISLDGKYRWKITNEDGSEYIVRPIINKENHE